MKKLISLLAMALCGVALVGCGGDEGGNEPPAPTPKEDVFGWHMTSWEIGGEDTDFPKEVYLVLTKDAEQTQESVEVGTFTMYQDVVSNGFEKITGTYTFNQATRWRIFRWRGLGLFLYGLRGDANIFSGKCQRGDNDLDSNG